MWLRRQLHSLGIGKRADKEKYQRCWHNEQSKERASGICKDHAKASFEQAIQLCDFDHLSKYQCKTKKTVCILTCQSLSPQLRKLNQMQYFITLKLLSRRSWSDGTSICRQSGYSSPICSSFSQYLRPGLR